MEFFHLSNNSLQGELTSSICNATSLEFLSLSHNYFTKTIPYCISSSLQVLNLSHNKFACTIPHSFNNSSLAISVLDLQMNRFSGTIPQLFEKGNNLMTLNLVGNILEGSFPRSMVNCTKLKVLDVAMRKDDERELGLHYIGYESMYQDSIKVNLKGLDIHLEKILTVFTTIDVYVNMFEEKILEVIGELSKLKNKLEECVPMVSRFETLSSDSFKGNKGLHGFQLDTPCYITHEKSQPLLPSCDTGFFEFGWKPLLLGYICGASSGTSMFWVLIFSGKCQWIARMVNNLLKRRRTRANTRRT
ncbi:receptor-like protein Cf-9 homolog [Prosopis cineraria]|uniref:receptor-like protein Cf-9 homolog n=1 Tax=Prosopis cineraria TaxID=364024 RepID=UPI0024102252|nr:receptor-like protein Cf-9 homolog [Prosopis cineraria]